MIDNGKESIEELIVISNIILSVEEVLESISKREIHSIFREIKQKDRKELDTAVLEALGLNPKEYLPRIYKGITELVKERLELPKMRKKKKSQVVKVAYDQIKEAVIKDIIPNGCKEISRSILYEW